MPTTDLVQKTAEAIATILDTLAGIVAITGRASGNIMTWDALRDSTPMPALAYQFSGSLPGFGDKDTRILTFSIAAFAEGNGAQATVNALIEQVELGLTHTALTAQGLDACPDPTSRPWPRALFPIEEGAGVRGLVQATVDVSVVITK